MMYSHGNGVEILKARTKAYRFPKGKSGNPDVQSRFYHESRKLANRAAPELMRSLIDLTKNAEDECVRSACLVAVLDRAGIRPIDKPEPDQEPGRERWDPSGYSLEELEQIRAALRLMREDRSGREANRGEEDVEIIPPNLARGGDKDDGIGNGRLITANAPIKPVEGDGRGAF
jgi:hypothetical protein